MSRRIAVTGASGFVGQAVCAALQAKGHDVLALSRQRPVGWQGDWRMMGDLRLPQDWVPALRGAEAIVHLAAAVHDTRGKTAEAYFQRVNVEATRELAQAAAATGIRTFVLASSIKAQGETSAGGPMRASDVPRPLDAYGRSKLLAEQALRAVSAATPALQARIVRPPLVYGPGVGANFLALMAAARAGRILPLGAVTARRSLVFVGNLADLIVAAVMAPVTPTDVFLVSDDHDLTVPDLYSRLVRAFGNTAPWIPPVPVPILTAAGRVFGRGDAMRRLTQPLQVDIESTRVELRWRPPFTVEEGLALTCRWYESTRK